MVIILAYFRSSIDIPLTDVDCIQTGFEAATTREL
jgi:hypothetical protein